MATPNPTIQDLEEDIRRSEQQLETEENEKVRAMYRSHIANTREKIALMRYKEARNVKQARLEALGYSPSEARRRAERFDPDRPNLDSTEARLAYQASRGDEDAAARLRNKRRLRGRGEFYSRTIPEYRGETTGKTTGIYQSPLTGREVVVREGGATTLPPVAAAQYTEAPASDFWSRDYTVVARVREPGSPIPGTTSPDRIAKVPERTREEYPRASARVPVLIEPERPPANFQGSAQPEGTGTTVEVPRYFATQEERARRLTLTGVERPGLADAWEDPGTAVGFGELREGDIVPALKEFDLLGASSAAFQVGAYKFTGGMFRTGKAFIEQPAESLLTLGAYVTAGAAGGALGGPAGAYTAVGSVFAAQNVYEFRTGETPTVVRAVQDPITFAGEVAPFVAFEGVRSARAKTKAAAAAEEVVGTVVTQKTAEATRGVPSVELRVEPLEAVRQTVQTTESSGSRRTLGVQEPVFGEPTYLTAAELERAPVAFLTDATVRRVQQTKPAGGSVEGVSAPGYTVETRFQGRGRTNAQELTRASQDRVIASEAQETALPPYLERRTLIEAEYRFTGYDPPAAWELVVNPEPAARGGPGTAPGEPPLQFGRVGIEKKGGSLGYEPKLDYFEEFAIGTPEGKALIRESPYTGYREVTVENRPYVVTEVKSPGRPPAPPKTPEKGTTAVGDFEVEIEVPQSDGTVKIQKVKLDAPPKTEQETTSVAEQKQKSVFAEQETVAPKQATQAKPDQRFKYVPKAETGKPFAEAIVRFKGLSKVGGFAAMKPLTLSLTRTGSIQGTATVVGTATTVVPAQDQAVKVVQLPAQDAALDVAQEQAARQATRTTQITDPASLTRTRLRTTPPEPPRTPKVPKIAASPARKDKRALSGFGVLVRRRGRFETVGKGLEFEEAVKKGAGIVAATAAASFKVEPEGEPSKKSAFDFLNRQQFRPSKREAGVIVERSRFRISTPGEVGEISRKGQAASKRRRKKKLFGGGFKWAF